MFVVTDDMSVDQDDDDFYERDNWTEMIELKNSPRWTFRFYGKKVFLSDDPRDVGKIVRLSGS